MLFAFNMKYCTSKLIILSILLSCFPFSFIMKRMKRKICAFNKLSKDKNFFGSRNVWTNPPKPQKNHSPKKCFANGFNYVGWNVSNQAPIRVLLSFTENLFILVGKTRNERAKKTSMHPFIIRFHIENQMKDRWINKFNFDFSICSVRSPTTTTSTNVLVYFITSDFFSSHTKPRNL